MVILSSPTGFLEITIFLFAVVAFVLAIRFFMDSRKRLQELFPGSAGSRKLLPFGLDRSGFVIPKTFPKKAEPFFSTSFITTPKAFSDPTKEEIRELRRQLQQQQQELAKALDKIASIGQAPVQADRTAAILDEQKKLEQLRVQVEKKDAEIQRLKQQESYTQKMQEQFEEVQTEFEKMQEQMHQMEQQAWQTAELTLQLEHTEQAQLQMEETLLKKEDKLRELTLENQRLQNAFEELEEKHSEASTQRVQLLKKVQLLESLNADMMQMAETNRKLKSEISRVAELESMLHLMRERRNA